MSRVSGDVATRRAAKGSYARLRDLLAGRSSAQAPPLPLMPTVLTLAASLVQAAFRPRGASYEER